MISRLVVFFAYVLLLSCDHCTVSAQKVYRNVARNRPATQSSILAESECANPDASKATDENSEGYYAPFCSISATKSEMMPWWEVDLGYSTIVKAVIAYNRIDEYDSNAMLRYAFQLKNSARNNLHICYTYKFAGLIPWIDCTMLPSVQNVRYVRVQVCLNTGEKSLFLAEVKVFGDNAGSVERNLALNKKVTSDSATECEYDGRFAVDGSTEGQFMADMTSVSNTDSPPSWQVDIGNKKFVNNVRLFSCWTCSFDADQGINVTLLDSNSTPLATQNFHLKHGDTNNMFNFDFKVGNVKYVRVHSLTTGYFRLPEVQVWGYDEETAKFDDPEIGD